MSSSRLSIHPSYSDLEPLLDVAFAPPTEELGYPCYLNSNEDFLNTPAGLGRNARAYVNFARTILLMLLAIATLVIRYRAQRGRLIHVIRRDGGLYYLTVAGALDAGWGFSLIRFKLWILHPATRLVAAVVTTPTVVPVSLPIYRKRCFIISDGTVPSLKVEKLSQNPSVV